MVLLLENLVVINRIIINILENLVLLLITKPDFLLTQRNGYGIPNAIVTCTAL